MDDNIINIIVLFPITLLLFWFLGYTFSVSCAAKEEKDRVAFVGTWHPANTKPPDHPPNI